MFSNDDHDSVIMRLRVLLLLMLTAFLFLGIVLWREQVVNARQYETSLDKQSIRRVRLPAARGRIYDRNGVCMADNSPSYCLELYVEELREAGRISNTVSRIDQVIDEMAAVLGVKRQITERDISLHLSKRRPMSLLAWKDLDQKALARWAESAVSMPGSSNFISGVDIYVEPVRCYPAGRAAAHILGYVGRVKKTGSSDGGEDIDYYLPEMQGKRGVERVMNQTLAGEAGGKLLRVNASGFKYDEEKKDRLSAMAGMDVVLTVDMRIQVLLSKLLEGSKGAAVVLDPSNGDILALCSAPDFDPNEFSPSISQQKYEALTRGDKPLLNRAIAEVYPPGSIFKPIVAIAAMENKKATAQTSYNCPGYFALGRTRFGCWQKSGHGWLGLRKAVEQSCNSYFCHLGLSAGNESIYHIAYAMGLGRKTNVELGIRDVEEEASGLLPDEAWKRRVYKDAWRTGDTCNLSIGQGALNVTPIQMAVVAATIANGGKVYRPRIIMRNGADERRGEGRSDGDLVCDMEISAETLSIVRGGMRDVIQADTGTGKRAKIGACEMAGKTGTAQYGARGSGKQHTWMIVFAPVDNPRYALSMIIEDGLSGGQTVAPLVKQLMEGVLALEHDA